MDRNLIGGVVGKNGWIEGNRDDHDQTHHEGDPQAKKARVEEPRDPLALQALPHEEAGDEEQKGHEEGVVQESDAIKP